MRSEISYLWVLLSSHLSFGCAFMHRKSQKAEVSKLFRAHALSQHSNSVVHDSLRGGKWVKFISGASNQDLPLIRNLCFIYTLAGVDCIDVSADPAVVTAAETGIEDALNNNSQVGAVSLIATQLHRPLLMISVNDEEDPHFRKASFDPRLCPSDCPRPCEKVCPAWAIPPLPVSSSAADAAGEIVSNGLSDGVVKEKCYGCGRCLPVCPLGLIDAVPHRVSATHINDMLRSGRIDAIEIHTQPNHERAFHTLWSQIGSAILTHLKVVAVSFPNMGADTIPYLRQLQHTMSSAAATAATTATAADDDYHMFTARGGLHIWQADGRPMSGDIGRGTAHAAAEFAAQVLDAAGVSQTDAAAEYSALDFHSQRHFVQLAGGTNSYSAATAQRAGLIGRTGFGGYAFGGYARKHLNAILNGIEEREAGARIERHPAALNECMEFAAALVHPIKTTDITK